MTPSITMAPAPITLRGNEWRVSPLSDRDIEEVNNWLRSKMINMARNTLSSISDQEARDEILGAAVREASKLDFMAGRGFKELMNRDGIARILYQSLLREHPTITLQNVKHLLSDDAGKVDRDANERFAELFTQLNMPVKPKKKENKEKKDGEDGEETQDKGSPKE